MKLYTFDVMAVCYRALYVYVYFIDTTSPSIWCFDIMLNISADRNIVDHSNQKVFLTKQKAT